MSVGTTAVIRGTFSGLDKRTVDILRSVARRRDYPAQTTLCHQGEIEHTFYLIVEGNIAIAQTAEDGTERILAMLGPNKYFGEMGLVDDSPRNADCITVTPVIVLEVTEDIFDKFVAENPIIAHAVLRRILANKRQAEQHNIEELREKNKSLEKAYRDLKAAQAKLIEQKRVEHELALAADVQRSLLPGELPQFDAYAFAAYLQPARQVGGDFYDVIALDDEHVGVLIADVADKGFHAALFMAVMRTLFLQKSRQLLSPAAVAQAVHQGMLDVAVSADIFVTAFYGVLHRPSGQLTYVRAGHERPLLYRPGSGVESLTGDGRFLGMWPELTLTEQTIQLQPGDRLLLFSDGVPDAVNLAEEHYDGKRLAAALTSGSHLPASDLVAHIMTDVTAFCQGAAPFDDLTLLAVEVVKG